MKSNSGHHPIPLCWYLDFHGNAMLNFINTATAVKFVLPIPICSAYLVPLDVDVTGNITAKLCEVGSEFNIFCTLVTMATATILNLFNPPTAATHYSGYSYKVS